MSSLTQIGQYRIESSLGAGAWTETFHAYDVVLRRPVALKLLHSDMLPTRKNYLDFLAAVRAAADLVHPRIAWVWEAGETEGKYWIAERFVGGESLAARLSHTGPLAWVQALKTSEQIAQAIEFGEERQWTHGRVTPHNILLSADHGAVLSDYGLVNACRRFLAKSPPSLYDAVYLPPEVLEGQPVTARADQYALACTLVEMLSGKNPFEATNLDEILVKKTTEIVEPLLPLESIPMQAGEVIERALYPEPSARFDNALDFVSALDRAVRASLTDSAARAQHEEHLRRWREAEEKTRLEAEEAARRAALEQARREIQEQARIQAELAVADFSIGGKLSEESPADDLPDGEITAVEPAQAGLSTADAAFRPARSSGSRRKTAKSSKRSHLWPVYTAVLVIALGLGGFWLNGRQSGRQSIPPTATLSLTNTQTAPAATPPAVLPPSSTASPLPTSSATLTNTSRPSATPSRTPTVSPSPSSVPSSTPTETARPTLPTITPDRPDRDNRTRGG